MTHLEVQQWQHPSKHAIPCRVHVKDAAAAIADQIRSSAVKPSALSLHRGSKYPMFEVSHAPDYCRGLVVASSLSSDAASEELDSKQYC